MHITPPERLPRVASRAVGDAIDELIEAIVVDAYGDHEELACFEQAFEENVRFPIRGRVVGVDPPGGR